MTIVAGCGLAAVFRRDKAAFWFLALFVAADLAHLLGYEIAQEKAPYELAALVALTIAAGLVAVFRRDKAAFLSLGVFIAPELAGLLAYKIPEDKAVDELTPLVALSLSGGPCVASLIN